MKYTCRKLGNVVHPYDGIKCSVMKSKTTCWIYATESFWMICEQCRHEYGSYSTSVVSNEKMLGPELLFHTYCNCGFNLSDQAIHTRMHSIFAKKADLLEHFHNFFKKLSLNNLVHIARSHRHCHIHQVQCGVIHSLTYTQFFLGQSTRVRHITDILKCEHTHGYRIRSIGQQYMADG